MFLLRQLLKNLQKNKQCQEYFRKPLLHTTQFCKHHLRSIIPSSKHNLQIETIYLKIYFLQLHKMNKNTCYLNPSSMSSTTEKSSSNANTFNFKISLADIYKKNSILRPTELQWMCLDKVQSNNIIAYLHTTANVTGYLNLSSRNNTSTNTITSTNKNNYQTFLSVKNYNPLQNT